MNYIQTLYIDTLKDPFRDSFGWVAPEYHLMSWALSCLQLHKLYGNISLFANSPAACLLIDTLQLPYTDVQLVHNELTLIHPNLWALPKLYTYSLQEQPFLHIDGDVFLFSPFNSSLLEGELIAQNVEVETKDYYTPTKKELMRSFTYLPPCVKRDFERETPILAVNAGILGGNHIRFFHDYAVLAFDYVDKNADRLKHINVNRFNVFFEQHLFFAAAKENGIPINCLFEGIVNDNGYKHLGDFHDVPFNRSYLHLLGDFKRDEYTCIQMAAKLRELFPEYYERIVALFHQKNLRLSPCGFKNPSPKPVDEQRNTHLQRLKFAADRYPSSIERKLVQSDFDVFYNQIISFLKKTESINSLLERDSAARHWYRDLFGDHADIMNYIIVRCQAVEVVVSTFDWAGLFNKYYRIGVKYYFDLQLSEGQFFNLVVSESTDNGFSLYDINAIDYALLLLVSQPLSIKETLIKMQQYFEHDVLQNHYEMYKDLILTSIKQLVVHKAIRPFGKS